MSSSDQQRRTGGPPGRLADVRFVKRSPIRRMSPKARARQVALIIAFPDPFRCQRCQMSGSTTRHHVIPRSLGGTDTRQNIAHLCCDCHRGVHDHTATDWRRWLKGARG